MIAEDCIEFPRASAAAPEPVATVGSDRFEPAAPKPEAEAGSSTRKSVATASAPGMIVNANSKRYWPGKKPGIPWR